MLTVCVARFLKSCPGYYRFVLRTHSSIPQSHPSGIMWDGRGKDRFSRRSRVPACACAAILQGAAVLFLTGSVFAQPSRGFNLVRDPGFEAAEVGIAPLAWRTTKPEQQTLSVVSSTARTGAKCLRIENGAEGAKQSLAMVEVMLGEALFMPYHTETNQYLVEASVKLDSSRPDLRNGRGFAMHLRYVEASTTVGDMMTPEAVFDPAAEGWQDVRFIARRRWRWHKLGVGVEFWHPGTLYVDDVRVTPLNELVDGYNAGLLEERYRDAWPQINSNWGFDGKSIPAALVPHLGTWEVSKGRLRPAGTLPPSGAVIRGAYTYLPEEVSFDFALDSNDSVLFLLMGDWKFSLYPDHLGVRYLYQPLVLYPQVDPMDAAPGRTHRFTVNLQPHAIRVRCDDREVMRFSAAEYRKLAEPDPLTLPDFLPRNDPHWDPLFTKPLSRICFQPYRAPVSLDNIRIRGLRTGTAQGFERIRHPDTPVRTRAGDSAENDRWPHSTLAPDGNAGRSKGTVYRLDARESVSELEQVTSPGYFRYEGQRFDVVVAHLKPGPCTLQLAFYEDEVRRNGARRFDVGVNRNLVFPDVDVIRETGANFIGLIKECQVRIPSSGDLVISLKAETAWNALLNAITVVRDEEIVYSKICNFRPRVQKRRFRKPYITPSALKYRVSSRGGIANLQFEPPDTYSQNIIINGGFETGEAEQREILPGWSGPARASAYDFADALLFQTEHPVDKRPRTRHSRGRQRVYTRKKFVSGTFWHQGSGEMKLDSETVYRGETALRLQKTNGPCGVRTTRWVPVDWTRPYELRYAARAQEATGRTVVRLDWFRKVNMGTYLYCGKSEKALPSGSYGWRHGNFCVKAPYGASLVHAAVVSEDNQGTIWIDDLSMDGYGAREVEVKVSHGGYDAVGNKEAVVWARDDNLEDSFQVVRVPSNRVVYEGALQPLGLNAYTGRYTWKTDFSAVREPGTYQVKVKDRDESVHTSFAFPVDNDFYRRLLKLGANYFRIIRSTVEVPGWHGADFVDDGIMLNLRDPTGGRARLRDMHIRPPRYVPMLGGSYDAGDFSRKPMACLATYGFDEAASMWHSDDNVLDKSLPDPLHLAWWQVRMHVESQLPDGSYLSGLRTGSSRKYRFADPASLSDGIPGTGDEKGIIQHPNKFLCFPVAHYAWTVRDADRVLSQTYADSALRNWRGMLASWTASGGDEAEAWKQFYMDGSIAWTGIYLEQLFPENHQVRDVTKERIRKLIAGMNARRYLDKGYLAATIATYNGTELVFDLPFAMCALDYARFHPESPEADAARAQMRVFLDEHLIPALETNEFGKLGELGSRGAKLQPFLSYYYHNCTIMAAAQILARSAVVFDHEAYLAHAERQLHWLLGKNYFDVSFVAGVGEKLMATRNRLGGVGDVDPNAIIPGGMMKGYNYAREPFGFPLIHGVHADYRDGYKPAGQEYWKILGAYFVISTQEISQAMRHFQHGEVSAGSGQ